MPKFGNADAKEAIRAAEQQYNDRRPESTEIDIGGQPTVVIYHHRDDMWNFGLPELWVFDGNLAALTDWWLARHPDSNARVLPRKLKERVYQVNLQFQTPQCELFNYHLTVD